MLLNINQLRAFYFTAKLNSVKFAANELMVTPPAITKQIKQFEEFLGVKLMFRESNGIKLTTKGEEVFRKSEGMFDFIREMELFFDSISGLKMGELKMGCPPSAAIYILPKVISKFKEIYPDVKLVLEHGTHSDMIQNILNRKYELAVVCPNMNEKRIKIKILWEEDVVLITATESSMLPVDEISLTDLSRLPLILPKKNTATSAIVHEYYLKFRQTPNITLECDNMDLIKKLVINDQGVSFMAYSYVREEIENKKIRVVRILAPPLTMAFGLGYLQLEKLSPAAMALLELIDKLGMNKSGTH